MRGKQKTNQLPGLRRRQGPCPGSARAHPRARPDFLGLSLPCALSRTGVPPEVYRQPLARRRSLAASLALSCPPLQPSFLSVGAESGRHGRSAALPSRRSVPTTSSRRPPDSRSGPHGVLRAPARAAAGPGRPRGRALRRAGEGRAPSRRLGVGKAPGGGGGGARGRRRGAPAARGR